MPYGLLQLIRYADGHSFESKLISKLPKSVTFVNLLINIKNFDDLLPFGYYIKCEHCNKINSLIYGCDLRKSCKFCMKPIIIHENHVIYKNIKPIEKYEEQ